MWKDENCRNELKLLPWSSFNIKHNYCLKKKILKYFSKLWKKLLGFFKKFLNYLARLLKNQGFNKIKNSFYLS